MNGILGTPPNVILLIRLGLTARGGGSSARVGSPAASLACPASLESRSVLIKRLFERVEDLEDAMTTEMVQALELNRQALVFLRETSRRLHTINSAESAAKTAPGSPETGIESARTLPEARRPGGLCGRGAARHTRGSDDDPQCHPWRGHHIVVHENGRRILIEIDGRVLADAVVPHLLVPHLPGAVRRYGLV